MFQTGPTIKQTLDDIQSNKIVLPAIQREFVWRASQICRLFDSLMQDYPFGTFLYWRVEPENSGGFQFYDFVLNYHQRNNPRNSRLPLMHSQQLTAVLDGQQRLTALNVGLRGSMAWKLPRRHWNTSWAFPRRQLYLDLLWKPEEDDETGSKYRFSFLTNEQFCNANRNECWFPVGQVLEMSQAPDMLMWVTQNTSSECVNQAFSTLFELFQVVHNKNLIAFYEEHSQELDKVLQIFIRLNSGGTILSYSDMLFSVAVAEWDELDAREEIHTLVDEMNKIGGGFSFSKDLVLKAGLMLCDVPSVGFKVDNFNTESMDVLEAKWHRVKKALMLTVQMLSQFGFSRSNLRAHNAILPIAYYLFLKNYGDGYLSSSKFRQDRQAVREWLIRSLLKSGVWSSGVDGMLVALRLVIRENGTDGGFPVARILKKMAERGRALAFDEEEIDDLSDMRYSNQMTFGLLSLLFPFVDLNNKFHIDHIFPVARFTQRSLVSNDDVPDDKVDEFIQRKDGLANLQLLQGTLNLEKSDKLPAEWLRKAYCNTESRQAYQDLHLLGEVPESIAQFDDFHDARRELLKARITQLLGRQPSSVTATN